MPSIRPILGCITILAAAAPLSYGSAFAVNELGARAQGMGGAYTSIANDPSAIFFNPAGIAFLKGTNFQMDNLVVAGQFRFIPTDPPPGTTVPEKGFSGATSQPFIPIASLYFTKRMNDRMAFGFGGYTPFGLAANFTNFNDGDPANTKYTGRWAGTRAALQSYWFQPTVALKLTDNAAIALGVAYVYTHLFLEQSFLNPNEAPDDFGRSLAKDVFPGIDPNVSYRSFARLLPEGRLRAAATGSKVGFSAGYLWKNRKSGINIGLMWRSAVVTRLKGDATFAFTGTSAIVPFLPKDRGLDVQFPNQKIQATFLTPASYVVGISKTGVWGGTLAFDARLQDFKRFRDLAINFEKTADAKGREIGTKAERRLTFDFNNSFLLHAGFEKPLGERKGTKMMDKMLDNFTWRAGYTFDHTPVPPKSVGPLFPDNSRHSITGGMTKRIGSNDWTAFYQWMQMVNRTTAVPANNAQGTNGQYNNFVHLAGVSLRFRMGKAKTEKDE